MLALHTARNDSVLSLANEEDAMCVLRWIMSVIHDGVIVACQRKVRK